MAKKTLQLGRPMPLPASPDEAMLDRVPNPHPDTNYVARFTAPEFTCALPGHRPAGLRASRDRLRAGQLAGRVEVAEALSRRASATTAPSTRTARSASASGSPTLLKPKWLRIGGYWYPRGGMPIDVFWQTGKLPKGVWVPDQGVAPYRGRG